MSVNVLSGDSLVENFRKTGIEGEMIVCRESFVDGDLTGENLEDFWATRENYLNSTYSGEVETNYTEKVTDQFIELWNIADGNTVNLWFEYELFCQVNLWFTIWLLRNSTAEFYIVYPKLDENDRWSGFRSHDPDELKSCFDQKMRINDDDLYLGVQLWEAFQKRDFKVLKQLGEKESQGFPTLKEVCEAACEIDTRPKETLSKIISGGKTSFGDVLKEFCGVEGVYGFGDLQVKRVYHELNSE